MSSFLLKNFLLYGAVLANASTLRGNDNRELADPKSVEQKTVNIQYVPSKAEQYALETFNADGASTSGCEIYFKDSIVKEGLRQMVKELDSYYGSIHNRIQFAPDVRELFHIDYSNKEDICHAISDPFFQEGETTNKRSLKEKSSNIDNAYFEGSQEVSYLETQGFLEPLLPPFSNPMFCLTKGKYIHNMDYLVEDFGHVCRNTLTKESKTAFFDIGATYNFVGEEIDHSSPVIQVIEKYRKFGIHFDDIFAYELLYCDTDRDYKNIPDHMRKPLHWINTGVSIEPGHMFNPWTTILENYKPEDFVVVKLDICTPSVELPLVQQLLDNPELHKLVDVFYFKHHAQMDEIDGLMFFNAFRVLRNVGIASHYLV